MSGRPISEKASAKAIMHSAGPARPPRVRQDIGSRPPASLGFRAPAGKRSPQTHPPTTHPNPPPHSPPLPHPSGRECPGSGLGGGLLLGLGRGGGGGRRGAKGRDQGRGVAIHRAPRRGGFFPPRKTASSDSSRAARNASSWARLIVSGGS